MLWEKDIDHLWVFLALSATETSIRIGLEVHVQITTLHTKLFCSCSADYRHSPPNTHVCPVCLGLPGALPVVNEDAVRKAIATCLALNGVVAEVLRFDRKHYFYPDLPKNYQITQYLEPICKGGYIELGAGRKKVRIRRINLEEDPGRIIYPGGSPLTSPYVLVDYNRSGVALLEIVTEPDIESPEEAVEFLEKLRSILEHLGVCDCGLEGAMRVDANISVAGGARVEVKNIGSTSEVERALRYELVRQKTVLSRGGRVERETRHWDPIRKVTMPARVKEAEEDYRYMPDPNLPPIQIPRELVEAVKANLPELPDARVKRLMDQYGLPEKLAYVLVYTSKILADFFEDVVRLYDGSPRRTANYIVNDLLGWLKDNDLRDLYVKVKPEQIAKLMRMLDEGIISIRQAKEMAEKLVKEGADPEELARKLGYTRITDESYLKAVVDEVFRENPKAVRDALKNPKAVNFLVGMVMRKTRGRADPAITRKLIERKLSAYRDSLEQNR